MKKLFVIAIMLAAIVSTGCTKFKAFMGDNEAIMQLATEVATARVIADKPAWKEPIVRITDEAIIAIDEGKIVSVENITALVLTKIDMGKLRPDEQILVRLLIQKVTAVIQEELTKQGVQDPAKHLVEVRKVLGWVNGAAKL